MDMSKIIIESIELVWRHDDLRDLDKDDRMEMGPERVAAWDNGDWCYLWCHVSATLLVNGTVQEIRTAGVGGIESDCGEYYRGTIETDEFEALLSILSILGLRQLPLPYAKRVGID